MTEAIYTDALRAELEAALVAERDAVAELERRLSDRKARRDELVVRLRRLPLPPSARAVAELAGISNPWVLKLERGDG